MCAIGVVRLDNNGECQGEWFQVLYVVDYPFDVGCGICVDPLNILESRKPGQDDTSIFSDALYNSGRIVARYPASHIVSPR